VTEAEAERIARTESLFREVNERIAEAAERFGSDETSFVCECADPTCTDRVEASLDDYERVREDGATFMLVPGHADGRFESVVTEGDEHSVVEKREPDVREVVLELDPRS
jgi:hypothetical protein